jgi:hypothetical protein
MTKFQTMYSSGATEWAGINGDTTPFVKFNLNEFGKRGLSPRLVDAKQLMMKAPELLAALERMRDAFGGACNTDERSDAWNAAREVIDSVAPTRTNPHQLKGVTTMNQMSDQLEQWLNSHFPQCGLNADWVEATWMVSPGKPNVTAGLYLNDNTDGTVSLVWREFTDEAVCRGDQGITEWVCFDYSQLEQLAGITSTTGAMREAVAIVNRESPEVTAVYERDHHIEVTYMGKVYCYGFANGPFGADHVDAVIPATSTARELADFIFQTIDPTPEK